jgi:TolB-like protein
MINNVKLIYLYLEKVVKKMIPIVLAVQLFGFCSKPADLAELTAPVAYAIATNALKNGKSNGKLTVELAFQSLHRERDDWPSGTITATVSTSNSDKKATVTYILNGTHIATAVVEIPGKQREQYSINLVESAIVFGQAQTIENHLQVLSEQLASRLTANERIAVFDAETLNGAHPVFGKSVAESLVTSFSRRGLTVVERKLLDTALKEINFQSSGLTGDEVRKKMGSFLGADTMLVATVKGSKQEIVINARCVDIEKGNVKSSGQIIIPRYLISMADLEGIDR